MAFQLVYTSSAKLLDAGRSGFGTVARSKSITPLVVSAIERVSQFANMRGLDRSRMIHVHRQITAGSNRLHVLTRICDAGADYTGRTNHIAHHLVISKEEAARAATRGITPADVLRQFAWLDRWDGNARFFDASEDVSLDTFRPDGKSSGRQHWSSVTGNPAHSRLLSWESASRTGVLIVPAGIDRLALLAEALVEFGPQSWSRSFTTSLETTDELADLEWIITTPSAFPEIQPRCGSRTLLDLTNPGALAVLAAPSLPAPALKPATNQVYAPEKRQLALPDPSPISSPVNVPAAEKQVVRTGASVRRPSAPAKKEEKSRVGLIVGIAAVVVLGLIALLVVNNLNSVKPPNVANDTTQKSDDARKAINRLLEVGVKQKDAENIVESLEAKESFQYSDSISTFIERINDAKKTKATKKIDEFGGISDFDKALVHPPKWHAPLVTAKKLINDYADAGSNGKELFERLEILGDVREHLEQVANTQDISSLTSDSYINMDTSIVVDELNSLIASNSLNPSMELQLKKSIEKGLFDEKIYSNRLEALRKFLDNNPTHLDKIKKLKPLIDGPKPSDNGTKNPTVAGSVDTGTKNNEQNTATADSKKPIVSDKIDFSGVKTKQIILVSQDTLKNGIEIDLLKSMLKNFSSDQLVIKEFHIMWDDVKFEKKLPFIKDLDCYSDNFMKPKIKIRRNGNIAILEKFSNFELIYKNNIQEFTVSILIDEKNENPFNDKLIFALQPGEEKTIKNKLYNTAIIGGSLADALYNLKFIDESSSSLKFEFLPTVENVATYGGESNGWLVFKLAPEKKITFTQDDAASIQKVLAEYAKIDEITTNNQGEKDEKTSDLKTKLEELKTLVTKAIGGYILREGLNLQGKEITKKDWKDARNYAEQHHNKKGSANYKIEDGNDKDFNKEIEQIQLHIGEQKFKNHFETIAGITWENLSEGSSNLATIKKHVNLIQFNTIKKQDNSWKSELEKINSITIKTKKGRTLFRATKAP